MNHLQIFTDGSVHAQSKVGYGAYLAVTSLAIPIESLKDTVKVKRFAQTSSTRLELQTLLWALHETMVLHDGYDMAWTVYTDSQNIIGLPGRRVDLERNNYFTSKNKRLSNYELYQEFYRLNARLNCQFVKVIGHQAASQKDEIGRLFTLVDRASRHALREDLFAHVMRHTRKIS